MLAREETHSRPLALFVRLIFNADSIFYSVSRRRLIKLLSSRSLACFFLFSYYNGSVSFIASMKFLKTTTLTELFTLGRIIACALATFRDLSQLVYKSGKL